MKNHRARQKSILLACYDFPPNDGIGGRRWAKLAKGLTQLGYDLHVISAKPWINRPESPWTSDVMTPRIHRYELPRRYPRSLTQFQRGPLGRILFRFHRLWLPFFVQGTIYDLACLWERTFINTARELVQGKNIKIMIATGAPFNLLYYSARVKAEFPDLKLIIDYRDPWLHSNNYGMPDLDAKRRANERTKQDFVFRYADLILAPNPFLLHEIQSDYVGSMTSRPKFGVLEHCYDFDDYPKALPLEDTKESGKNLNFIYAGGIYEGVEHIIASLSDALGTLRAKNVTLYQKLRFRFFTEEVQKLSSLKQDHPNVEVYRPIGKKIYGEAQKADFICLFLNERTKDYLSTKFYDFLPVRKPFLCFGPDGEVKKVIRENSLGMAFPAFDGTFLAYLENETIKKGISMGNTFAMEKYSLKETAKRLESLLEE